MTTTLPRLATEINGLKKDLDELDEALRQIEAVAFAKNELDAYRERMATAKK